MPQWEGKGPPGVGESRSSSVKEKSKTKKDQRGGANNRHEEGEE